MLPVKLFTRLSLGSLALSTLLMTGCSVVYEDLDPCPTGVDLNIQYTRNILGVDAFEGAVHCAEVHVYDKDGKYVGSWSTANTNKLSLELPAGEYRAVVYGGMECEDASFAYNEVMGSDHHYSDLQTWIKNSRADVPTEVANELHPMYHAAGTFTVEADTEKYNSANFDLTKNTNTIQVLLQHADGSALDPSKFNFSVTADNAVMGHDNSLVAQGSGITYKAYETGTTTGAKLSDGSDIQCAYGLISTARLMADGDATLHVDLADGTKVVDLSLPRYLNMIRANELRTGTLQDYLDKQDNWSLVFVLDPDSDQVSGLVFKVNNWILDLSNSQMDF